MFQLNDEQLQIQAMARRFAEKEVAPYVDEWEDSAYLPREVFKKMAELGFTGMYCSEEYGGLNLDRVSAVLIAEEFGRVQRALGFIFIHNLVLELINDFGTQEQREYWLPLLANGDMLAAFGLTEPGAGSDAANIRTRAVKDGNRYILNGQKCFITNADVADVLSIAAKTDPGAGARGVSIFIVPKGTPGLSVPKVEKTMGVRSTHICEIVLEDCAVPAAQLLGGVENKGFPMLMKGLEGGRLTNGSLAVGVAQGAFEIARDYAKQRNAFGNPIANLQAIQFMLADMATEIEAARWLVRYAAWRKDQGLRAGMYASMGKRYGADMAMKVTTDAVQVLGGYGYIQDYKVERMMRDAKMTQIVEGTSQIQRTIIAREILKD
ncbi:acyl-CoA dehydrogenase family protein [Desulfoscipio gibsoniae]|uniref:Acyl-CoA dehydrogenase n=1 Tax=Desulfoscipio gibsoniae DSM 7213 TaxID=767817 RepID=R4KEG3_9FIRM|nr:acyl-CoA dehydrogenase family protein [Desulfoscipio gibsoniae]AGL00042.1 acyl-CoA dehydrogenase [Desulfoscipio gibsoniae DSM 7213]